MGIRSGWWSTPSRNRLLRTKAGGGPKPSTRAVLLVEEFVLCGSVLEEAPELLRLAIRSWMDDIHESRRARPAAARGGIGPEHDRVLFGGEDVVHVGLVCALGQLGELREHTDHCLFALVL